jgi:hypothetical protein
MEKSKVLKKVRELVYDKGFFGDSLTISRAEYGVIMNTFGISWNELKQPSDTFSLYYELKQSEGDLRGEFEKYIENIKLCKEKSLPRYQREYKLMLKGFIKGVRFFNQTLSDEFSLMADKRCA